MAQLHLFELKRETFKDAKAVWLTPLLSEDNVLNALVDSTNKGLCFIDDKDRFYIVDRFNRIKNNPNIIPKLIPNVNHILEYDDDPFGSIDVLKGILTEIEQFKKIMLSALQFDTSSTLGPVF